MGSAVGRRTFTEDCGKSLNAHTLAGLVPVCSSQALTLARQIESGTSVALYIHTLLLAPASSDRKQRRSYTYLVKCLFPPCLHALLQPSLIALS